MANQQSDRRPRTLKFVIDHPCALGLGSELSVRMIVLASTVCLDRSFAVQRPSFVLPTATALCSPRLPKRGPGEG